MLLSVKDISEAEKEGKPVFVVVEDNGDVLFQKLQKPVLSDLGVKINVGNDDWYLWEIDKLPYEIDGYGFVYVFWDSKGHIAYKKSKAKKYKSQLVSITETIDEKLAQYGF